MRRCFGGDTVFLVLPDLSVGYEDHDRSCCTGFQVIDEHKMNSRALPSDTCVLTPRAAAIPTPDQQLL